MTKKRLRAVVLAVTGIYVAVLGGGVALALFAPRALPVYKDLLVVDLAIPAAWLAYAFQRRLSYMSSLRALWSRLVRSVRQAVEYTYTPEPTREAWRAVLLDLEIAIDETRQVFKNLDEASVDDDLEAAEPDDDERERARRRAHHDRIGHYPFQPLKEIRDVVVELGFGPAADDAAKEARAEILDAWARLRIPILSEFERDVPAHPVTPYAHGRRRSGGHVRHTAHRGKLAAGGE